MKITCLKLSSITIDAGTQIRAALHQDTIKDYAEAMRDGAKFPDAVVFHDGSQYFLADGFHRFFAASQAGFTDLAVEIRKGTRADALRFALGANVAHGVRRTNADKRKSVELAIAEWPDLPDVKVAELCAVSHTFVQNHRKLVATVATTPEPATRKDSRGHAQPARKPRPQSPAATPPPPALEKVPPEAYEAMRREEEEDRAREEAEAAEPPRIVTATEELLYDEIWRPEDERGYQALLAAWRPATANARVRFSQEREVVSFRANVHRKK